jgi:hypothetical protein
MPENIDGLKYFRVKRRELELYDDKSKKRIHMVAIAECSLLTLLCCGWHSRIRGDRLLARDCPTGR